LIDRSRRRLLGVGVGGLKVRAISRVVDADNEELLLVRARVATGAKLARICVGFRKVLREKVVDEDRLHVHRHGMRDGTVQSEMRCCPTRPNGCGRL